jgi:sugar phosphate isomerase/epimerase
MYVSCCAYSYRKELQGGEMTLPEFVETARAIGLDAVELTSYYFPDTEPATLHDLKRHVFQQGLAVSGTAVGGAFTEPDPKKLEAHIAMVKEWIDHSVVLGSPCMRVFAGPVPQGETEEKAVARAVEGMKECAKYGAERGVLLAVEDHGGITATAEQVLKLVELVGSDWFGLNLDCGNFRADPYREIEVCAPHALTTHVKVTTDSPQGRFRLDYRRVMESLAKGGYHGPLSIEYEESDPATEGVPRFAAYLQGMLAVSGRRH